jgi:hypothetical protein
MSEDHTLISIVDDDALARDGLDATPYADRGGSLRTEM